MTDKKLTVSDLVPGEWYQAHRPTIDGMFIFKFSLAGSANYRDEDFLYYDIALSTRKNGNPVDFNYQFYHRLAVFTHVTPTEVVRAALKVLGLPVPGVEELKEKLSKIPDTHHYEGQFIGLQWALAILEADQCK